MKKNSKKKLDTAINEAKDVVSLAENALTKDDTTTTASDIFDEIVQNEALVDDDGAVDLKKSKHFGKKTLDKFIADEQTKKLKKESAKRKFKKPEQLEVCDGKLYMTFYGSAHFIDRSSVFVDGVPDINIKQRYKNLNGYHHCTVFLNTLSTQVKNVALNKEYRRYIKRKTVWSRFVDWFPITMNNSKKMTDLQKFENKYGCVVSLVNDALIFNFESEKKSILFDNGLCIISYKNENTDLNYTKFEINFLKTAVELMEDVQQPVLKQ